MSELRDMDDRRGRWGMTGPDRTEHNPTLDTGQGPPATGGRGAVDRRTHTPKIIELCTRSLAGPTQLLRRFRAA